MDFFIKKNSTLPILFMKVVDQDELDIEKFEEMLSNCAITFSMINTDTGIYSIANKSGGLYIKDKIIDSSDPYEFYIYYKFTEHDTRKVGNFIGEFKINFLGQDQCGTLIVPIKEPLNIYIQDSITKTTVI